MEIMRVKDTAESLEHRKRSKNNSDLKTIGRRSGRNTGTVLLYEFLVKMKSMGNCALIQEK